MSIMTICFVSCRVMEFTRMLNWGASLPSSLTISRYPALALGYARHPSLALDGKLAGNPAIGTFPWCGTVLAPPRSPPRPPPLTRLLRWARGLGGEGFDGRPRVREWPFGAYSKSAALFEVCFIPPRLLAHSGFWRVFPRPLGTRFAHCPMEGRMYGGGFDGRGDGWEMASMRPASASGGF